MEASMEFDSSSQVGTYPKGWPHHAQRLAMDGQERGGMTAPLYAFFKRWVRMRIWRICRWILPAWKHISIALALKKGGECKLRNFKRVATRYDKVATSFLAFVSQCNRYAPISQSLCGRFGFRKSWCFAFMLLCTCSASAWRLENIRQRPKLENRLSPAVKSGPAPFTGAKPLKTAQVSTIRTTFPTGISLSARTATSVVSMRIIVHCGRKTKKDFNFVIWSHWKKLLLLYNL